MKPTAVILGIAFASALGQAHSDGWKQFRGPNGSGVAKESRPPVELDAAQLAWKTALPPGLSSPVLSGERVCLTGLAKGRLVTIANNKADGKIAWQNQAPKVEFEKVHKANHPAAPSVLVGDKRVFTYFGSYGLLCHDHDGRELWKKPIPTPKTLYGMSTSPIVHGKHLIMVLDNDANLPGSRLSQSKIVAYDKTNGDVDWEIPRPLHRSGWSTPMIWKHGSETELVVLGNGRVSGYDMKTGTQKWFVPGFSRETISTPVAGNNVLYVSSSKLGGGADIQPDPLPFWEAVIRFDKNSDGKIERKEMTGHFTFPIRPELPLGHPGYGIPLPDDKRRRQERLDGMFRGTDRNRDGFWSREEFMSNMRGGRGKPLLIAIRPGGQGNITDTHLKWELNRSIPEIPSPLLYSNLIYMVRNGGLLAAVDATNGKLLYRERLNAPGQYSASPVAANGHVYLGSNRGIITVVKVDKKFEIIHQHDLKDPVLVSPAIDKSTLYVRTEKALWAFRAPD